MTPATTDWSRTAGQSAARLGIFLLVWFNALWIVDDLTATPPSYLLANIRLALWLFLAEFLVGLYGARVGSGAAGPWPALMLKTLAIDLAMTVAQALVRGAIVYLVTVLLLAVPTPFAFLPYLAAVLPTLIAAALRKYLHPQSSSPASNVIRGGTIMSFSDAAQRAEALRKKWGSAS